MKKFKFFHEKDIFSWVNLTFLKKVVLLFLGISICMYFLHLRFLLERFPHKINFSWNLYKFLCYFFLTILFAYILKRRLYPKISKNKLLIWIKEKIFLKIILVYDKALEEVYNFFIDYNKIPFILNILYKSIHLLANFFNKFDYDKADNISITIFYLITIIPRVIVLFALLIDVIYFNEYYYLYRIIWVLIIPFIWKIFFFCINIFYKYTLEIIERYYTFSIKKEDNFLDSSTKNIITKVWYQKRTDSLYIEHVPYSEEEYKQMEKDIYLFYVVNDRFISYYNSNGLVTNAPIYQGISCLITYGYMYVWFYMAIKIWLSI